MVILNVFFPENTITSYKRDALYSIEDLICKLFV